MKNKLPKVSIIIVSWNGLHWLKKSIPSLAKIQYSNVEIIVVDNASKDETVSWIKHHYPQIQIVKLEKNTGFAEANNEGFIRAKGDYILFLNNDVLVTKTFLDTLVNAFHVDPSIGGVQSKMILMDDHTRLDAIGAFLTPTGFLYHHAFMNKDTKKYHVPIDLYTAKGACMMFPKRILDQVLVDGHLFDPECFAYFEETDLCHRIWLTGKRIVYVPDSVIYHKMGGTSTTINNSFIQYHSFKNRLACYLKNISVEKLLIILPFHLFVIQIFAVQAIRKGNFNLFLAVEKAVVWNIIHLQQTMRKRHYIQQHLRIVPDNHIWQSIYRTPPLSYYLAQMQGKPYEAV